MIKWLSKRKVELAKSSQQDADIDAIESSQVDPYEPESSSNTMEAVTLHGASLENKPVSIWGPALAVLLPLGLFITLLYLPHYNHSHMLIHGHFMVVSAVSILAAVVAFMIGMAGRKLRNSQVTLLSMAFISLGIVFGLHGLSTPGFILEKNAVVEMSAPLSILLAVIWMYFSSLPSDHPIIRPLAKTYAWLVPAWTALLVGLSGLLMYQPSLVEVLPLHNNPLRFLVAFIALELAVVAGWNYWQHYLYTRAPLPMAIVYSAGWLAVSAIIMSTGALWYTSWWIYHGLLLLAAVAMVVGLAAQYNRGSLALALIGKGHKDPVERLEAAISPGVRRLINITEAHDAYTAGHNYRVAVMAVHIGRQMGLSSDQLRALAQGGMVHDLGKLQIPSEILNKSGKLEADERERIETHPVQGYSLAKCLGFMPEELDIIRYHHERWDGTGYPNKLSGEDIPLLARITAIADVYDALTSERAYRQPWSHEQARTFILGQVGLHFDPECVEAWDQGQAEDVQYEDAVELMTATAGATASSA